MNDQHRFLDIEPELRPTAQRVAEALRADVPPEIAERHEALLRAQLVGTNVRPIRSARRRARRTLVTLAAAAVLVLALPIVAVASDRAVPGDLLYGVDRAVERFELAIASGPTNEVRALLGQATERIDELETLTDRRRLEAVGGLLEDLQGAVDDALDRAEGDEGLVGAVHEAIEMHTQRLQGVRDRLGSSGETSTRALTALDRAIEAGRGATEADDRGRPADTRRPEDRGRQERPGDAPETPGGPTQAPGQPDDAGSPDEANPSPANPPAGPDEAPDGSASEGSADSGGGDREVREEQTREHGDGDEDDRQSTREPERNGPPGDTPGS